MKGRSDYSTKRIELRTRRGLGAACEEADRRLGTPEMVARVAEIAGFLQKVQRAGTAERESEAFQRLVWDENPLYRLSASADLDIAVFLADPKFRRWFRDLIERPLPTDKQDRANRMDAHIKETYMYMRGLRPGWKYGPILKTTRTFAAFFPHDFTSPDTKRDLYGLMTGRSGKVGVARANRIILDKLEAVVGPVDPSDRTAVARRMLFPELLLRAVGESTLPDEGSDVARLARGPDLSPVVDHFESIRKAGRLVFEPEMVESLHLGLYAHERRHFAALTGLSGTGKTLLATEYAKALTGASGESNGQVCTIAVQPGWHDPTPLLGYVNPLAEDRYVTTEFLRFLIRAAENQSQPHVCVLDEMNLSHPEQYLAPLLSAMERDDGPIELHGGDEDAYGVPSSVPYPGNLVLIGTVNMDETTMGLSDKVLDRAFTLEFWDVDVERWPGWRGSPLRGRDQEAVKEVLGKLMAALSPARLHFGWRVIEEVVRFMEQRQTLGADLSADDALDRVLYAKVLPKLRGDDAPRVRRALDDCRAALRERNLRISTAKVEELIGDLEQTGSFRFWR